MMSDRARAKKCDSCGKFAKHFIWAGDGSDEGTECEHCMSECDRAALLNRAGT